MNRRPGLILPIDPKRSTWWALVEFLYCAVRDVLLLVQGGRRTWRRAHRNRWVRIMRTVLVSAALGLGGAAADQHFHLLRLLLTALAM